jgi:hypothetical protein
LIEVIVIEITVLTIAVANRMLKTMLRYLLTRRSTLLRLWGGYFEFITNFVSIPVKMMIPRTQVVFLMAEPRRMIFELSTGIPRGFPFIFTDPSYV